MNDIFKKALKQKLRFSSPRLAQITTEDLFSQSIDTLDIIGTALKNQLLATDGKVTSLLNPEKKNEELQLKFDIVSTILTEKVAARDRARKAADTRQEAARLMELIARKEDQEREGKSKEELQKQLSELLKQAEVEAEAE